MECLEKIKANSSLKEKAIFPLMIGKDLEKYIHLYTCRDMLSCSNTSNQKRDFGEGRSTVGRRKK